MNAETGPRRLALAMGFPALGFLALTLLVAVHPDPIAWDQQAFDFFLRVNPDGRYAWGDSFAEEAVDVAFFALLYLVFFVLAWRRGSFRFALGLGTAVVLHELVVLSLQTLLDRPRPSGAFDPHGAYPSGHVANFTLALIVFVFLVWPLFQPHDRPGAFLSKKVVLGGLVLLPIVYAAYRVWSGEHWITDVVGSLLLGTAWGSASVQVLRNWNPKAADSNRQALSEA